MEDYIFDGKIHAINNEYAYAIKLVESTKDSIDYKEEYLEIYRNYIEYLLNYKKESVIEYILGEIESKIAFTTNRTVLGAEIIFKEPTAYSCLNQYGTLAIKFERAEKDNLGERV